jgi:hypothetical protein
MALCGSGSRLIQSGPEYPLCSDSWADVNHTIIPNSLSLLQFLTSMLSESRAYVGCDMSMPAQEKQAPCFCSLPSFCQPMFRSWENIICIYLTSRRTLYSPRSVTVKWCTRLDRGRQDSRSSEYTRHARLQSFAHLGCLLWSAIF